MSYVVAWVSTLSFEWPGPGENSHSIRGSGIEQVLRNLCLRNSRFSDNAPFENVKLTVARRQHFGNMLSHHGIRIMAL
jgi:hypothetical protein